MSSRSNDAPSFLRGQLVNRPNRFLMKVRLNDGDLVEAFCPNTSRLIGLLEDRPGLLLSTNDDPDRKTDYTVRFIDDRDHWVGIEASKANELFQQYLEAGPTKPFNRWQEWEREVTFGDSQLDFLGKEPDGTNIWTEVKSLSSRGENNRTAFFSGTPSRRGWRHLGELERAVEEGDRGHCVFIVQRPDVVQLAPGEPTDPRWLEALRSARDAGVSIHAYRCDFDNKQWSITDPIPVLL